MTDKTLVEELKDLFRQTHETSEYGKILLAREAQGLNEIIVKVPLTEKGLGLLAGSLMTEIEGLRKGILLLGEHLDQSGN